MIVIGGMPRSGKIESQKGIDNLGNIFGALLENEIYIMLDKEDLYTDLKNNNGQYEKYIQMARDKSARNNITVLELQGVIFGQLWQ